MSDATRTGQDGAQPAAQSVLPPGVLEGRTLLAHDTWVSSVYPDAFEAAGALVATFSHAFGQEDGPKARATLGGGPAGLGAGSLRKQGCTAGGRHDARSAGTSPEARADDRERSLRRARGAMRRLACIIRPRALFTFTSAAACFDRAVMLGQWAGFLQRARRAGLTLDGVRTLEWHPQGHGLHIHALIRGYQDVQVLEALWGHGHVDVTKARRGSGGREGWRLLARYLIGYLGKELEVGPWEHRYEPFGDVPVVRVRVEADSLARLIKEALVILLTSEPAYLWTSHEDPDWRAPPAFYLAV